MNALDFNLVVNDYFIATTVKLRLAQYAFEHKVHLNQSFFLFAPVQ